MVVLQHAPTLSGGVTMDNVSHLTNVVMGTESVLMAVMNSTAVSNGWLALPSLYIGRMFLLLIHHTLTDGLSVKPKNTLCHT